MIRLGFTALVASALLPPTTTAFVPPTPKVSDIQTVVKMSDVEIPSSPRPIKDISYGEASRQYRRTVYSHDDWRVHRNPDRFLYYLASFASSGVYKNIGREVLATTTVAVLVCLYNALVGGYVDFSGTEHAAVITDALFTKAGLPLTPFTLCTSSLGLLLGMWSGSL